MSEITVEIQENDAFFLFEDFVGKSLVVEWQNGLLNFSGEAVGTSSILLGAGAETGSFLGRYTLTKKLEEICMNISKGVKVEKIIFKMVVLDVDKYTDRLIKQGTQSAVLYGLYKVEVERDGNRGMINDSNFIGLCCNAIGAITPQDIGPVPIESTVALVEGRVVDFNNQMEYLRYRMGTFCKPGIVPPYFMVKINDDLQNRIPVPVERMAD